MADFDTDDHELEESLRSFLEETWEREGRCFPVQVVVVASYMTEDGEMTWSAHTRGNGLITSAIGLLEYAKRWLVDDMLEQSEEDL